MNIDRAFAEHLRHEGLELIKLAADIDAALRIRDAHTNRDEIGRLRCCGAGPDQRDPRTGEDIHFAFCPTVVKS